MRSIEGQGSDGQPIRRTPAEKQKLLRNLREKLASMKSHTAPALRQSLQKRIAELEADIGTSVSVRR